MKKIALSLFMVAGLSLASYAQGLIGPKVGMSISSARDTKVSQGSTAESYQSIITPQLGIVFNAKFGEYVSFRPEILYLQRGFKTSGFGFTSTVRCNYVEVPLNVVGTFQAGPGKIEAFAGPSFGYMFGGKAKSNFGTSNIKGEDQPANYYTSSSSDIYMNYLNISLNAGVGYNWKGLIFQAGYNLGFSNLSPHHENRDSQAEESRGDDVTKFSSVNLAIIYLFGGKE